MTNSKKPTVEILTERPKLAAGASQTVDLLVRITPPDIDETQTKRAPLNLSIVLDRSGSMEGQKIEQAKEAAKACIDRLQASDRFSTLIFDDVVDVLIPSQLVSDKYMLKRAINSIQANASTALHEAWVRGGLQVSEHLDPLSVNRVLVITDGLANVGETRVDHIVSHAKRLAEEGVSTSTIGIGADFNEDLLMPMAEAGQGNAWHVREPQDITSIFATEVAGLLRQFAHNVSLKITPNAGVVVSDLLNDLDQVDGRYQLPNLLAGDPIRLVVKLVVPAGLAGEKADLIALDFRYIDQTSGDTVEIREQYLAEFANADAVQALPINGDVIAATTLLMNARSRREAMELLDRHDREGAMEVLFSVSASTNAALSKAPSPALEAERSDLENIQYSIARNSQPAMSRKRLAYRRETLRKDRQ